MAFAILSDPTCLYLSTFSLIILLILRSFISKSLYPFFLKYDLKILKEDGTTLENNIFLSKFFTKILDVKLINFFFYKFHLFQ